MKTNLLYYRITLGVFCMAMIGAVLNSFINYESVSETILNLGYPPYLLYIIGTAQTLGVLLLITNKAGDFTEWIYAGFFFNLTLGFIAHLVSNLGNGASAILCLIPLFMNYFLYRKITTNPAYSEKTESLLF